jgi:hypothetical protein
MAKTTLSRSDIEQAAVQLVKQEVNEWADATAFVTEDIAFNMRNMIKTFRKNYFGIFDKPYDSASGKKKIWVPLTESTVDAVRKNIDLDTKDINLRAKRREAIGLTEFVRNVVRSRLDQMFFGEKLDRLITNGSIDGTAIWKTMIRKRGNKKSVDVRLVDPLNLYIDPTAECIQDSVIIERAALTVDELRTMDGWENVDDVKPSEGVSRNEKDLTGVTNVDLVDVYERWGQMPKSLVTGKKEDEDEFIEGHIVVSGIGSEGGNLVHLIEENREKDSDGEPLKPYEEFWYSRVPGRWYGRGPAEKVMFLQVWLNTIVNIRINRSYVSQLGIFKVRKGSGITPQMLSGLAANGAVVMNNMDDLQQLPIQEASQASYNDEQVIQGWARQVTSTFESVSGESLPASMPATNAVIQSRAAQGQFFLVKEQLGMFLQRWMKRHFIPMLASTLTKNSVERITGDTDELRRMDESLANKLVMKQAEALAAEGKIVNPKSIMKERDRIVEKLQAQGPDRFVQMMEKVDLTDYDVQVFVTNEEIDKGVLVQNLLGVFQTAAQVPDMNIDPAMVAESIFDIMGLETKQFKRKSQPQPQQAPQPQGQIKTPSIPSQSPQEAFTNANVPAL